MNGVRNEVVHKGKFVKEAAECGDWKAKLAVQYYSFGHNSLLNQLE